MSGFTQEELEEMRRFDAEIDAEPDDVRELWEADRRNKTSQLYPRGWTKDKALMAAYKREYFQAHKAESYANYRAWYAAHIEQERKKARERARKKQEASKCAPNNAGQSGK